MEISTKGIDVLKAWSKDDRCFATERSRELLYLNIGATFSGVYVEDDRMLGLVGATITSDHELKIELEKKLDNSCTLFITIVLEDEYDILQFIYNDLLHFNNLCELVVEE